MGNNKEQTREIIVLDILRLVDTDIVDTLVLRHQGEFSLVASIKVKFLASVTKNVVLSF